MDGVTVLDYKWIFGAMLGVPDMGQPMAAPREDDWGFRKAQGWKLKLCWQPQTCFLTGKQLWGRRAYHGVRIITGPSDPVFDHYWVERDQFLFWNLMRGK